MKYAIGVDIGGTNIKAIIINEIGEILHEVRVPTVDDGSNSWIKNVGESIRRLTAMHNGKISAVGLAAPGLPDKENKFIEHLPNRLLGLVNYNWSEYLGIETLVMNDAHAATFAEKIFGVAKNIENFILLTLGTGVGGGIVINGKLIQGLSQMAGHLGHTLVNHSDSEKSILGMPGSLEFAIGNYSVKKRSDGKFNSTLELVTAYQLGDYFASYIWLKSVNQLALSLCSMINMLSPEAIVLAGGITSAGKSLYDPLQAFMDIYEFRPSGKKTPIIQAKFDDLSGAMGAAGFVLESKK